MAFWTGQTNEPKRNYRFLITISGIEGDNDVIWWARNFKVPSYTVTETKHDFMDNQFYFPGRVTWEECTMECVDPVSPNALQITNQMIIDSGYTIKENPNNAGAVMSSISKAKANNAVGSVLIEVLNSAGSVIEAWTLKNAFLKGVTFSDLNYENDDLRTMTLTWKYDWAVCDNTGAGTDGTKQFEEGTAAAETETPTE